MSADEPDAAAASGPSSAAVTSVPHPAHRSGTVAPQARTVRRGAARRLLASELGLIFRRRRNLAGLGVLALVPIVIAIAVKMTVRGNGPGGANFFHDITGNGLFVALAALAVELPLFLPLAIAAISGDAIAGEANVGSLRTLLTAPVGRSRLLAVKYAAVVVSSFVATTLVAVVGAVVGLALFPGSSMTMLSGAQVSLWDGVGRTALAVVYLSIGFAALGAVGLFVSTLTEQPMGAVIAIVLINVGMFIADSIPQLSWLGPWLLTHWWSSFADLFRTPILWDGVVRGTVTALVYLAIGYACAWARFGGADVTS